MNPPTILRPRTAAQREFVSYLNETKAKLNKLRNVTSTSLIGSPQNKAQYSPMAISGDKQRLRASQKVMPRRLNNSLPPCTKLYSSKKTEKKEEHFIVDTSKYKVLWVPPTTKETALTQGEESVRPYDPPPFDGSMRLSKLISPIVIAYDRSGYH